MEEKISKSKPKNFRRKGTSSTVLHLYFFLFTCFVPICGNSICKCRGYGSRQGSGRKNPQQLEKTADRIQTAAGRTLCRKSKIRVRNCRKNQQNYIKISRQAGRKNSRKSSKNRISAYSSRKSSCCDHSSGSSRRSFLWWYAVE